MPLYEVVMRGPEVTWVHREAPEYYESGEIGLGKRRQVVAPAEGHVVLEAADKNEAEKTAVLMHPEYDEVVSVKALK